MKMTYLQIYEKWIDLMKYDYKQLVLVKSGYICQSRYSFKVLK
jgi:hypothetical protein